MTKTVYRFPVVDLFAGPGGLGEGFAALRKSSEINEYAFRTAISIERDIDAHSTLQLRHFYHAFGPDRVPNDYYKYLEGTLSLEALYQKHPTEAAKACRTAWKCTLGEESHDSVKQRIAGALEGHTRWVLVGGPPCQAYSLVGRSRMMGNPSFESDPRHFLYREYLRILADHQPPVFVMENVKGLLSSKVAGDLVIHHILRDLSNPQFANYGKDDGRGYRLYSLSESGPKNLDSDPAGFIVKAEEYGVPQARHRIFIVGIRDDIDIRPSTLQNTSKCYVEHVIGNMPRLRSGISKQQDSFERWKSTLISVRNHEWFRNSEHNGMKDLAILGDSILDSLSPDLSTIDKTYTVSKALEEWFGDSNLKVLTSHEARSHMESDLHRYFFAGLYAAVNQVSPKLSDFPSQLLPNHKNVDEGRAGTMFSDRFRVQLLQAPATTITSHISKDGHYFIHPDPSQCRSLTVREAARLQTFPDNYKFEGPRTSQYHQVGNAVPPLLAHQIAIIIHEVLEGIISD